MRFTGTASNHKDFITKLRDHATTANSIGAVVPGANTGDGTVTTITAADSAPTETWTLTATTIGPGATFTVSGSVSGAQTNATSGVAYDNGIVAFTITDGATPYAISDSFTFTVTQLMGIQRWEEERYSTTSGVSGSEYELILKGVGTSGSDEIFIGFKSLTDGTAGTYSIIAEGFTSYESALDFDDQPGSLDNSGLTRPLYQMQNSSFTYWFYIKGRSIRLVANPSARYQVGYSGFLDPFSSPSALVYPLYVGATSDTETVGSNVGGFFYPYYTGLTSTSAYFKESSWLPVRRAIGTSLSTTCDINPFGLTNRESQMRSDSTGKYHMMRSSVYRDERVFGQFEDAKWISSFGPNQPENTVTDGGDTYDVFRAESEQKFIALKR